MQDRVLVYGESQPVAREAARNAKSARRTICVCLAVAAWWAASGVRTPAAESVVYRSLRGEKDHRLDELNLPRRVMRTCHWGWEVRSRHFVVFSTVSAEQALWTARRMEQTWSDVGRLADQWTHVHRQPEFGIGAVAVMITNEEVHPRAEPAPGPAKTNYGAEIFVNLAEGSETLEKRLPQLRREAFLAFLRVAQQDQVLPDWVQVGLADYFSGAKPPIDSVHELQPPKPAMGDPTGVWARRVVADRMAPLVEDRQAATLWVRYFLEGYDAAAAPTFLAGMAAAIDRHPQDPFHPAASVGGVLRFAAHSPPPPSPLPLHQLAAKASGGKRLDQWLADRELGQPIIRPTPEDMPLGQRDREMVLILKLARRFAAPAPRAIQPRIVEAGVDRSKELTAPADPRPIDLRALYRRLTDPNQPPWATLDTDGSLLLSSDRARLQAVFANVDTRYRVCLRDGASVLQTRLPTGALIEAWMEENPDNPQRPIVHIKPQSYEPPKANSPAGNPDKPAGG